MSATTGVVPVAVPDRSGRGAMIRRIRGWLTPATLLQRYWRAWSNAPLPPELQALLADIATGRPLYLGLPP